MKLLNIKKTLAMTSNKLKTVAQLGCGECAVICKISGEHLENDSTCIRLMEMGFTPGQEVKVIAKSPFRCPMAVSVRGTVIALRKNEAECIHI